MQTSPLAFAYKIPNEQPFVLFVNITCPVRWLEDTVLDDTMAVEEEQKLVGSASPSASSDLAALEAMDYDDEDFFENEPLSYLKSLSTRLRSTRLSYAPLSSLPSNPITIDRINRSDSF